MGNEEKYFLPQATYDHQPNFIPANWVPESIAINILSAKWAEGYLKPNAAACGGEHGFYLVDGADVVAATRYALCPSSASVVQQADDFRFTAAITEIVPERPGP